MTITQLEYVVAVATYRSFVAAAEKCFVTQPTLSMQIQKLEDELNVKIFDRNKHPIIPTEIGEEIIRQSKVILSEAGKINEIIQNKTGDIAGKFSIAIIPTLAPYIVPQLIQNLTQKHPKLQLTILELQTKDIIKQLKNDEIDCGLVSTPLDDINIKEYPLFHETLVAYFGANESALNNKTVNVNDLDLSRFWMLNEGNCLRNQVINLCSDQIAKLHNEKSYKYETSNVETLRKMVDKAGGMTILPEFSTLDFNEAQQDQIRYFEGEEPVRELSIVTNNHFVRKYILQNVMDAILEIVPEKMKVQTSNRKILRIQTAKL
jgi:LysR family hydrogen peroxide-inducible transcriptional activator